MEYTDPRNLRENEMIMAYDSEDVYSRSFQTKTNIISAMNRLCARMPFEKIRVDAIAREAGISRSSFYHHFADKNAAVQWITLYFYSKGLDQTGRTLSWFEGHMITTRGFKQFPHLLTAAAEGRDYGAGQPFYVRHRQKTLTETLVKYKGLELTDLLKFQIEALPHAEKAMANNFEMGKYDLSLRRYCELMVSLVPKELFEALEEPVGSSTFHEGF